MFLKEELRRKRWKLHFVEKNIFSAKNRDKIHVIYVKKFLTEMDI